MDGGIRRGTDIVKALCLGARAVLCGRAYAYGLAAAGEAGVARALEILRADVERTLKLLGCPSVAALDRSYVEVSAHWRWWGGVEQSCTCHQMSWRCLGRRWWAQREPG